MEVIQDTSELSSRVVGGAGSIGLQGVKVERINIVTWNDILDYLGRGATGQASTGSCGACGGCGSPPEMPSGSAQEIYSI